MSTSEYTHYIASYDKSYVENETSPYEHITREVKQKANPIYKNPITYYDSPVQNSMLYPNMGLIKPVDYDIIPVDQSVYLDKSIREQQRFAFGPYVIENRQIKRWA